MQTKTKHRIIGGIVLLAIVAIFLPLLFHNSRPSMDLKLSTQVPSPPAKPEVQLQLPALDNAKGKASDQNEHPQSVKAAAQETPAITQHILNTAPAPAIAPKAAKEITKAHSKEATPKIRKKSLPKARSQAVTTTKIVKRVAAAKTKPAKFRKARQTLLQSSVPEAWTIQVASFTNLENAKRLVKRLRDKGFDVYTRQSQLRQGTITRVFVGPIINQAKVKEMMKQLKQQFRLKGVIRRYSI